MAKQVAVIGAGYAGLSAAAHLAKQGFQVTVFEKNLTSGGRGRVFSEKGFVFDMGPSWYWMPEVFDQFFSTFGHKVSDFYSLQRLDPSYRVYFDDHTCIDVPANVEAWYAMVEQLEPGAGTKMQKFLSDAQYKYQVGMNDFVHRPGLSWLEFADPRLIPAAFRLDLFNSMTTYLRRNFKNEKLLRILEFPVIFLGAKPAETPAMYSLMNYADTMLGTWYPMGGMGIIAQAMESVCRQLGVNFEFDAPVQRIITKNNKAVGLLVHDRTLPFDAVVAGADYHHVEQQLLAPHERSYTESYWRSRKMSPSTLLFFVGLNTRASGLLHHTLFFDRDMDRHMAEIYDQPGWPSQPLFYVSCPSLTDPTVAPDGHENLFILIPVASHLANDSEQLRELYFNMVLDRIKAQTGQDLAPHIVYQRSYAHSNFRADYNAFGGNAFGLANTLRQTAVLKPKLKSKRISNLYFAGQLTTPGPGVPPSLISGKLAAQQVAKSLI